MKFVALQGWRDMGRWMGMVAACLLATPLLAQDRTRPFLVSVMPPLQAVNVGTTQEVSFLFSEAMNPTTAAHAVRFVGAFPPMGALAFDPSWSDQRTLKCRPLPAWPSGTAVLWDLGTNLFDLAGNPLANNATGGFTTSAGDEVPGTGTNQVTQFRMLRNDLYRQVDDGPPVLDPPLAALFQLSAVLASNRTASAVRLVTPAGVTHTLLQDLDAPEQFSLEETADTPDDLNARYTGGNYRFELQGGVGPSEALLFFPLRQPAAPRLANWESSRAVDAASPWLLAWQPWADGTAADTIEISIDQGVQLTPRVGEPGTLPGTASDFLIPAGTFSADSTNTVWISFCRWLATHDTSREEETLAQRCTITRFEVVTTNGSIDEVVLSHPIRVGDQMRLELEGPVGRSIVLETNAIPGPTGWGALLSTNLSTGLLTVVIPYQSETPAQFFRGRLP